MISLFPLSRSRSRSRRDTDGDGEISLEEFKTFMESLEQSGMQSGLEDVGDVAGVRVLCEMF